MLVWDHDDATSATTPLYRRQSLDEIAAHINTDGADGGLMTLPEDVLS